MDDHKWTERRACRDIPVRVFHELAWSGSNNNRQRGYEDAVAICSVCPVRPQCLEYAIGLPSVDGIFAGYDPKQIERMKRKKEEGC